jgi:O-antigen/teichoic acid export membrane protein
MFFRRTLSILSSQFVILVLALATGVFLSRSLGKDLKGQFDLVSTFASSTSLLLNLGIGSALIYYSNRNIDERPGIIASALLLQLTLALGGFIVFLVGKPYIQGVILQNKVPGNLVFIGILITPLVVLSGLLYNLFTGLGEFGKYNLVRVTQAFLLLITCVLLVGVFFLGALGSLLGVLIANLTALILLLFWLITKIRVSFHEHKKWQRSILTYGGKAWIGNLIQQLNYRLDVFLVNYFLSPGAVAIYGISVAISETLWYLPSAISTVLFPKTAMDWEKAQNFTPLVVRTTLVVSILLATCMAVFGGPVIKFVYGEQFAPAITPLIALLPGTILLGVGKIVASDLAGRGKPQYGTWGSLATLILTILFDLWLIPLMGVTGAGLASTISYGVNTLILIYFYLRLSDNHLASLFLIRKVDLDIYLRLLQSYRRTFWNSFVLRK